MQITNVKCPESKYGIKCPYEMKPDGVCIHNTSNDASAMSEVSYMLGNNNKTSFHVAVDNERVVIGIPFNRNAFHAGDGRNGKGNRNKISIEICYSKSGGKQFEEAERLTAEYIATQILKPNNWGIDKVSKHQDYSGKYCPHRTLDLGWQRFLNMIQTYLDGNTEIYNNVNNTDGSDVKMKMYANGSTSENVYADSNCTIKIGSLNPREKCECFGVHNGRAVVKYQVGSSGNFKVGYCKWLGGVR